MMIGIHSFLIRGKFKNTPNFSDSETILQSFKMKSYEVQPPQIIC